MSDLIISASILSADFANLKNELHTAEQAGIDWIHIDVMDGQFVPNITMGPFIVETCRRISNLPIDVHLMIEHPERHIAAFAKAGANRISVHIEGNPNIHRIIEEIRALNCNPAIVLNPGTPASSIAAVLKSIDMVLVMSVNPGFSGQEYTPESASKIAEIKQMLLQHNPGALIQVDGGINTRTLPLVFQAGATVVVAATAIFKHTNGIAAGVQSLRDSAN